MRTISIGRGDEFHPYDLGWVDPARLSADPGCFDDVAISVGCGGVVFDTPACNVLLDEEVGEVTYQVRVWRYPVVLLDFVERGVRGPILLGWSEAHRVTSVDDGHRTR